MAKVSLVESTVNTWDIKFKAGQSLQQLVNLITLDIHEIIDMVNDIKNDNGSCKIEDLESILGNCYSILDKTETIK